MADPHIDRLLDRLTIEFQASVAREEGEAAADLAVSLAQSVAMPDQIVRRPHEVVLPGRAPARVAVVGRDYLITTPPVYVVPLSRAIVKRLPRSGENGERHEHPLDVAPPEQVEGSLIELLRAQGRGRGPKLMIACGIGEFSGQLTLVGPDHLVLSTLVGDELLVAVQAIHHIRWLDGQGPRAWEHGR
jgi:hypothetical protein